jgi:hypothetical protein
MMNHPTNYMRAHTRYPNLAHSGRGWCPRCQTECVLLDDIEKYGPNDDFDIDFEVDA